MTDLLTPTCRNVYFSVYKLRSKRSHSIFTRFITEHFTGNQSVVINRQTCLVITQLQSIVLKIVLRITLIKKWHICILYMVVLIEML